LSSTKGEGGVKKLILEGRFKWLDRPVESGTTVLFDGEDQQGNSVSSTLQRLFRKYAPFNPDEPGKKVRITIERLED